MRDLPKAGSIRERASILRQRIRGWWDHRVLGKPYIPAEEVLRKLAE